LPASRAQSKGDKTIVYPPFSVFQAISEIVMPSQKIRRDSLSVPYEAAPFVSIGIPVLASHVVQLF
jgi:hypothetical protein